MKKLIFDGVDLRRSAGELYEMMMQPEEQIMFMAQERLNSLQEFEGWIQNRLKYFYHDFFMICPEDHSEIYGFVYAYEMKANDRHCRLGVYMKPAYRKMGLGARAALQMLDYLFRHYSLRKVYSEVYDYNQESLLCNLEAGFEEEGCLKEYRYFAGSYYDYHILSISQTEFYKRWGGLFS